MFLLWLLSGPDSAIAPSATFTGVLVSTRADSVLPFLFYEWNGLKLRELWKILKKNGALPWRRRRTWEEEAISENHSFMADSIVAHTSTFISDFVHWHVGWVLQRSYSVWHGLIVPHLRELLKKMASEEQDEGWNSWELFLSTWKNGLSWTCLDEVHLNTSRFVFSSGLRICTRWLSPKPGVGDIAEWKSRKSAIFSICCENHENPKPLHEEQFFQILNFENEYLQYSDFFEVNNQFLSAYSHGNCSSRRIDSVQSFVWEISAQQIRNSLKVQ